MHASVNVHVLPNSWNINLLNVQLKGRDQNTVQFIYFSLFLLSISGVCCGS